MEGNDIAVIIPPCTSIIEQDVVGKSQMIEGGTRLCPLCASEIKLFYVNLNEKILMCEKIECEFPFGHEDLKFVKLENGVETIEVQPVRRKRRGSIKSQSTSSTARSTTSTAHSTMSGWSDVEKICHVFELDDAEPKNDSPGDQPLALKSKKVKSDDEEGIKKSVEHIKMINKSLFDSNRGNRMIRNKKWLHTLQGLQERYGGNLVKPEELSHLNKPELGRGELKIDIDRNNMSSIKIQINCQNEPTDKPA